MADDLDEFLRQAAERRKNRQQQKNSRPPIAKETASPPPPLARPLRDSIPTLTSTSSDAYDRPNAPSSSPSIPLPPVIEPIRSALPKQNDSDTSVSNRSNARQKKGNKKGNPTQRLEPSEPLISQIPHLTASAEIVPVNQVSQWGSNSIAAQLRDPHSVRTAIILHEVLKRPWE